MVPAGCSVVSAAGDLRSFVSVQLAWRTAENRVWPDFNLDWFARASVLATSRKITMFEDAKGE